MPSLRHRLGALVYDWPRFLRHINKDWTLLRNRSETIVSDGRGVRCDWLYTSELHIANVYSSAARRLMTRALDTWPITLKDAPEPTNSPQVTFVIGHRGTVRLPNLLATLRSIAGQRDAAIECIVIEQSATREVEAALPKWVRYVHTPVAPDFDYCRAATFNVAARMARGEVLIAHDNDMLVPERYAAEVLERAREGWQFIDLKRFIFYVTEEDTKAIFAGAPLRRDHVTTVVQNLKGGSIAATREAYMAAGGFDEDFVGWGGEDLEFWERARAHARVYEFGYLPIVHLWHTAQAGKLDRNAPAQLRYERVRSIPAEERIARLRSTNFPNEK
ncbi:MAG TPA: galactosyltransferase-related protein [Thermoanaerobaculia bacterium]|nr:galactosyltransferase-related protein [Thermoanaerobaculia bacterium]